MTFNSPVYKIIPVPVEKIEPNTYNPNSVAPPELSFVRQHQRRRLYHAHRLLL